LAVSFETASKNEDIAKALKSRLFELTDCVAKIDSELHKPLSADSEEQAIETAPNI